MKKYTRTAS